MTDDMFDMPFIERSPLWKTIDPEPEDEEKLLFWLGIEKGGITKEQQERLVEMSPGLTPEEFQAEYKRMEQENDSNNKI